MPKQGGKIKKEDKHEKEEEGPRKPFPYNVIYFYINFLTFLPKKILLRSVWPEFVTVSNTNKFDNILSVIQINLTICQ
jgi:hypothetical protein